MNNRERISSLIVGSIFLLGIFPNPVLNGLGLLATLVFVVFGHRLIRHFWRRLAASVMSGVVAGVFVLGVGFRIAMRIVNFFEPSRLFEFTMGGTLFILIFIGAISGGSLGVSTIFLGQALKLKIQVVNVGIAGVILGMLLISPDFGPEIRELGAGTWMNVFLFGVPAYMYAWVTQIFYNVVPINTKPKDGEVDLEDVRRARESGSRAHTSEWNPVGARQDDAPDAIMATRKGDDL